VCLLVLLGCSGRHREHRNAPPQNESVAIGNSSPPNEGVALTTVLNTAAIQPMFAFRCALAPESRAVTDADRALTSAVGFACGTSHSLPYYLHMCSYVTGRADWWLYCDELVEGDPPLAVAPVRSRD
jgi:hypothetical protein